MDDTADTIDDAGGGPEPAAAPKLNGFRTLDSGRPATHDTNGNPQPGADPFAGVPPKYHVKKADGSVDKEASFGMLAEGYKQLERRLGQPTGRPKSPDEYVVEVPEEMASAFDTSSADFAAIRNEAFEQGLSPGQLQWAVSKYLEKAPQLVTGAQALDAAEAEKALTKVWTDPAVLEENIAHADRAVQRLGADLGEPLLRTFRNNPAAIQFLARIGAQLQEDATPVGIGGGVPAAGVEQLMRHPAYSDPKHADHAKVSAQVKAFYARQPGANRPIE